MTRRSFDALGGDAFDCLIIGGGITGCGIARDAAMRGLKVALVEQGDFAAGTSSRSSRLIHGGVRYLEHGYLHLVFEASRERRILMRIAPHLVHPIEFTWPVYVGARIPRWKLGAGLLLYDVLALFRNVHRHKRLSVQGVLQHEPALQHERLRGGALYYDAATDDARLTLANAVAAGAAGAVVLNYAEVTGIESGENAPARIAVRDVLTGVEVEARARLVVNAAGPHSEDIRRLAGEEIPPRTMAAGTKGVHILVPHTRVRNRGAVTMLSPIDGRVMFTLPAGRFTIVGTTDTVTGESPDEVRAAPDDVAYLLRSVNEFFPDAHLAPDDVISAWAGIRPLADATFSQNPGGASREHAIVRNPSGLLSITGGKLTTYRAMAEEVVDRVLVALGREEIPCRTAERPLPGGDLDDPGNEITSAIGALRVAPAARGLSGLDGIAQRLVHDHGARWRGVWAFAEREPALATQPVAGQSILAAELVYAVVHELACTLGDLLIRRSKVAFETRDHGVAASVAVADLLAPRFNWSAEARATQIAAYEREARRIFGAPAAAAAAASEASPPEPAAQKPIAN